MLYLFRSSEETVKTENGEKEIRTCWRFEACKSEKIDFITVQEMWADFLPLLMDAEKLISQYKGIEMYSMLR